MAFLTETSTYEAGIYQLETSDVVEGGAAGVSNTPLKHLANRTKWLNENKLTKSAADTMTALLTLDPPSGDALLAKGPIQVSPPAAVGLQYGLKLYDASSGTDQGLVIEWSTLARADMARVYAASETTGAALFFATNPASGGSSVARWKITHDGDYTPFANDVYSLGNTVNRVKDLYLSGLINFSTNDSLDYDRGANKFVFTIGSQVRAELTTGGTLLLRGGSGTAGTPAGVMYEGLRITNNTATSDDASIALVSGTAGESAVTFGDKDAISGGVVKYSNVSNSLEMWGEGDGTGAAGSKLILGNGGVRRSTSPAANDNSLQVATTAWTQALALLASPAGMVAAFARDTAPTGWLKCNGFDVSRSTYAALFAAIGTTFGNGNGTTTFGLPDLRGEFVRGWADTSSVDSGRVFGSNQSDLLEAHSHEMLDSNVEGGTSNVQAFSQPGGAVNGLSSFTQNTGGTETRPRNVALLYCIKT